MTSDVILTPVDTSGADSLELVAFLTAHEFPFELRLATEHRGQGWGVRALRAITAHVFLTMPAVNRFEGQTREDNLAMRGTFRAAGFVQEAHYREGWPVSDGAPLGSVAYAILRRDWETGTTTPVPWGDG